ncbi:tetratricopeptide repeat domain containing protein [Acanthamoeba castellanii str. Neff]|uniref:Tetratricopeptide repeat domain containing protein n=1 Tax=Acanthamoeba castellanii (strain ATCC 30010 / Neff) TaxID=1257118 RepID=L8H3B0_ACACF|nr:tetratricopeptide repeat domain containing protein [Acanthamoeba castellanii str. Neff]ELR18906.1 tetratricopeptide repeat domain containing protein [Acanthamoeba castellanii str. Neff]
MADEPRTDASTTREAKPYQILDDQDEDRSEDEEERVAAAMAEKDEGNRLHAQAKYKDAAAHYTQALRLAPPLHPSRAIFYANRAACRVAAGCTPSPEDYAEVIKDSTEALRIDPTYTKALVRRAQAYEGTDKLTDALKDFEAVLALDGSIRQAREGKQRLPAAIAEQQQREQEKMLGQLKDLGNSLLGKFGLSLDNFKVDQNGGEGGNSYSVKFGQ